MGFSPILSHFNVSFVLVCEGEQVEFTTAQCHMASATFDETLCHYMMLAMQNFVISIDPWQNLHAASEEKPHSCGS